MHIGQMTECFNYLLLWISWKLSQVPCALVMFLVKSKFSQVWILSFDYRQYVSLVSLFLPFMADICNSKSVFFKKALIAFILQLVLKRHGNTADIKIVDVENGILLTRSFLWPLPGLWQGRRERYSPGNIFERFSPGTDFMQPATSPEKIDSRHEIDIFNVLLISSWAKNIKVNKKQH